MLANGRGARTSDDVGFCSRQYCSDSHTYPFKTLHRYSETTQHQKLLAIDVSSTYISSEAERVNTHGHTIVGRYETQGQHIQLNIVKLY
jgi:hypothetical protein